MRKVTADPLWVFVSGWISGWMRYVVAVAGVLATLGLILLSPSLIHEKTFMLPLLAIAVGSAKLCGLGPSAVVTAIAALATAYFCRRPTRWRSPRTKM